MISVNLAQRSILCVRTLGRVEWAEAAAANDLVGLERPAIPKSTCVVGKELAFYWAANRL
jgi:hypothetical protein